MMTPRSPSASGGRLCMSAAASRIMLKVPIRLMLMTCANSASGIGPSRPTMRLAGPMPAQLMRMRAAPCLPRASASAAAAPSALVTSQRTAMPPILSATARAPSRLTSRQATLTPERARSAAVAAPSPEAPPVTIAACPFMSMSSCPMSVDPLGGRSSVRVLDQQRDALAAADAGRGDAVAQLGALELAGERDREPHAGGAQGVPDRDRAAVDVELALVETELARAGHDLCSERLVDLEAVDVGELQAGALEHGLDRRHRADAHDFRRHADRSAGHDARERSLAGGLDVIGGSDQRRRRAVDDGGGIAAGLHP